MVVFPFHLRIKERYSYGDSYFVWYYFADGPYIAN